MTVTKKINSMKKILIFPCATEVGIEYWNSLKTKKDVKIFGATSCAKDHSEFLYKTVLSLPSITDDNFVPRLNAVVEAFRIDLVIPTHVLVIDYFLKHSSDIKCKQLTQTPETTLNTRSKLKTYLMLNTRPYCPSIFQNVDDYRQDQLYFVKRDNGTGGIGSKKISTKREFVESVKNQEMVVCEYLPGDEITVDCFSDENFNLRYCFPRYRTKIRMGTSFRAEEIVCAKEKVILEEYVAEISKIFSLRGAWFAQFKKTHAGSWKLLEVDPRLSGSASINRVNGVNLAYLNVVSFMVSADAEIFPQKITTTLDRRTYAKFRCELLYDAVYIDLDNTIIVRGELQIEIIKFLFQCINNGYHVALLTKSLSSDLESFLKTKRIYQIFDEIIHISEDDVKSNYIDMSRNPIFIDDSFSQRKAVAEKLGIPIFDPDAVEALLQDRYV